MNSVESAGLLSGPYRIRVLVSSESQFLWALEQAHEQDRQHMVMVRGLAGLRGLDLNRGDEVWVLGYPDATQVPAFDAEIQRLARQWPHQVIQDRRCATCGTARFPWTFRRPFRSGKPDARLKRCRDCEAAAQRERHRARTKPLEGKKLTVTVADEAVGVDEDVYTRELAAYRERRLKGETRYV